jgi:short-subunit dehydrogenase
MIILVTGGSSGLGYEIVNALSKNKDNYIYTTYRNNFPSKFKLLDNVCLIKINFEKEDSIKNLLNKAENLDCLINNYHSGYIFKHTSKFTSEEVLKSFSTNISPLIDLNNHYIRMMKKNNCGLIISILSELTDIPPSLGMGVYTAEKLYLKTISEHWSKELLSYNVMSVNVSPKMLDTDFNSSIDRRYLDIIKKQGGFSKMEDIVKLIEKITFNPHSFNGKNLIV